jgi:anaerobic magnesium-protoporphyrin IX monomethyl ester cyclase
MGGSYVPLNHDVAIKDDNVDYFVVGEGEFVFKAILDYLSGSAEMMPGHGVVYRTADGWVTDCGSKRPIEHLDQLPFPKYEKIDFFKYATKEERNSAYKPPILPYGRITTSRGCPFSCCFCQVEAINGAGIRYRSAASVLDEVEMLIKCYKIKSLLVDDANFTADRKRAKAIIHGFIERQFALQWRIMNLAAYTLDTELLELMLESGCNHIDLAIESGSQRVLSEIIRKPINLSRVESILDVAKKLGFMTSVNFIIGLPGETWEEIRQTIRFAEDINVDYVKIMVAMPLRHTKLYKIAHDRGYLRKDFDFLRMRWGIGEISTEEFTNLDTTILRTYEWDRINFSSAEKIRRVARLMGVDEQTIAKMRVNTRKSLEKMLSNESVSC